MRAVLALILAFVLGGAAWAGDRVVAVPGPGGAALHYAVPKHSPVKFKRMDDVALATFRGRFRIEGEYRYGRLSDDPKNAALYDVIELTFVPDKADRARLPYWAEHGPVAALTVENRNAFVTAVIAPSLVNEIKERKRLSVTGRAAIWVDRYTLAFDCDAPSYSVRFLKVARPPTVVAGNALIDNACT